MFLYIISGGWDMESFSEREGFIEKKKIKNDFFCYKWFKVYDFIEYLANIKSDSTREKEFRDYCNSIMEKEIAGWRFVGSKICPITAKEEIAELEEALKNPYKQVRIHLDKALEKF